VAGQLPQRYLPLATAIFHPYRRGQARSQPALKIVRLLS